MSSIPLRRFGILEKKTLLQRLASGFSLQYSQKDIQASYEWGKVQTSDC